jgi:ubiquinone/menaquinone biosynthesis C-methylase UbiE
MDSPPSSIRQFVAEYRRVRLAEGFASADPRFVHQLPFRDATGRNAATWRIRAFHYLVIRAGLALLPRAERVLDVGAGNGWLSRRLAGSYRVTALDVDATDTGLGGLVDARIKRVCGDLESLPVRDSSFDVVIAAATIHYATRLPVALSEVARVLRPGGVFILADSPIYPDAEARDSAWQRTLAHYRAAGYPDLAHRYRGLTRAELEENGAFRFMTVSPGFAGFRAALGHLVGQRRARLPVLFGWKK